MNELPAGWVEATLDELFVEAKPGFPSGRHNADGRGIPHLRPMNVDQLGRLSLADVKFVETDRNLRISLGDVLFNNTNSPALVGKTAYVNQAGEFAYSNHMTRLRPPDGLDARFLATQLHYLWTIGFFHSLLVNHVNQASVSTGPLLRTSIVVPPIAEQRRIVAAIEEQFSRLDAAEASLRRVQSRLVRLRTQTLARAFARRWPVARIGEIATVGSGSTPKRDRAEYWGGAIPWVTSGQLNEPFVREPAALITEQALRETSVKLWPRGTLLVAMYGEGQTRGRCSELLIDATTNQACAAISIRDQTAVDRTFLKLFFFANYERNRSLASGGVQPNLSLQLIKAMEFPLPPLDEQRRIVAEVERQLSILDATKAAIDRALERSKALRRAILERAFTGRLVPQDPADEPASVLLERIRSERAAAASSRQVRSRRHASGGGRPGVTLGGVPEGCTPNPGMVV